LANETTVQKTAGRGLQTMQTSNDNLK